MAHRPIVILRILVTYDWIILYRIMNSYNLICRFTSYFLRPTRNVSFKTREKLTDLGESLISFACFCLNDFTTSSSITTVIL